jgi:hypothetical protein
MEIWKDIQETDNFYQVSNLGRFKRKEKLSIDKNGKVKLLSEKILNLGKYSNGYLQFSVKIDNKRITAISHRLVAKYFIENTDVNKIQVNHKNGIKNDNRIENLEWVTISENIIHSYKELNRKCREMKGENNTNCKITKEIALTIRELYRRNG